MSFPHDSYGSQRARTHTSAICKGKGPFFTVSKVMLPLGQIFMLV